MFISQTILGVPTVYYFFILIFNLQKCIATNVSLHCFIPTMYIVSYLIVSNDRPSVIILNV